MVESKTERSRAGAKGGRAESHKEHVKAGKAAERVIHHHHHHPAGTSHAAAEAKVMKKPETKRK
jgi:uncharacterized protein YbaA (DUF1428 family)